MLFLTNEPAKRAEINILTARTRYNSAWVIDQVHHNIDSHIGGI